MEYDPDVVVTIEAFGEVLYSTRKCFTGDLTLKELVEDIIRIEGREHYNDRHSPIEVKVWIDKED